MKVFFLKLFFHREKYFSDAPKNLTRGQKLKKVDFGTQPDIYIYIYIFARILLIFARICSNLLEFCSFLPNFVRFCSISLDFARFWSILLDVARFLLDFAQSGATGAQNQLLWGHFGSLGVTEGSRRGHLGVT